LAAGRAARVLIDEIDKAPRDFPNDLLNEIDQFWFRVPELAFETEVPETPKNIAADVRPIVVITSNTERQLPDAFLRRCVYHHIAFPDDQTLKLIVDSHVDALIDRLPAAAGPKVVSTMMCNEPSL
jgi:MoxR-like ATPase